MFDNMLRFLRILTEFVAAFAGVLVVLGLLLVWRLNANPVSSTFMTPYIESGIDHIIPDTHTQIANTLLVWDNVEQAIELHAKDVVVKDNADHVIAEVPTVDFRLSLFGLLLGQFVPTELTVDHPQIELTRRPDGHLYFGGMVAGSGATSSSENVLQNIGRQLTGISFMRSLDIDRAVFDIRDVSGASLWSVGIPNIHLDHTIGTLTGHAMIDVTQKDRIATLELHYVYDFVHKLHRVTTRFDTIVPAMLVGGHPEILGLSEAEMLALPLTGDMTAAFDKNLNLVSGSLQIQGGEGQLIAPDLWDAPCPIESVTIDVDYDRAAHHVNITEASFDFGGPKLDLTLTGKSPIDAGYDLDFDLNVKIAGWPMDRYARLWPKPVVANARSWIIENISKGTLDTGEAAFKGSLSWDHLDDLLIREGHGNMTASHAMVKYLDGMPPVNDVSASAAFDLNQMSIQIASGNIGHLQAEPFTIKMTDLNADTQYIDIPVRISSPIPDVINLIDHPPLNYAGAVGLTPDSLSGNVEGVVDLHFPLLKSLAVKDIDVKADASLTNVASSKLVKGVDITQGAFAMALDKNSFTEKGAAMLNGVPAQITWQQSFSTSSGKPLQQANMVGTIRDDQWKNLGFTALNGTHGPTSATLQMTQPGNGTTLLSGTLDMTAADIHVDQLNWKKPAGMPAILKFSAEQPTGKALSVKSISLTGPQLNVKGNAVIAADGGLTKLNLDPLIVGRTNASLFYAQADEADHALRFEAYGSSLDISGLRGGKEPEQADPRSKEYHIKVDRLYTSDVGVMANTEGYAVRDRLGWSAISLHGLADGDHKLDIDLKPRQDGGRVFSIFCDDFGKALKGMGFSDSVKNGELKIVGSSPPDNPRAIDGTVKIGAFDVHQLPVLALLLNATSPFGLSGILTDSVGFDRLKGRFHWEGDIIDLKQVEAAGNSVGMNIEGKVDMNTSEAKLHGTLVPFSMVNGWLGSIPLIGDVITGGNGGGILAVAYNIDGSLNDPKISVNPVSLLTPGFLRNLFFGGDDTDEVPPVPQDVTKP